MSHGNVEPHVEPTPEAEAAALVYVAAADRLADTLADIGTDLTGIREDVAVVREAGRSNRTWTRVALVSVCFDLLLSIGFAYNIHRTNIAVQSRALAAYNLCLANNEGRTGAKVLWDTALTPTTTLTPAQEATLAKLRALVIATYSSRDCGRKP